MKVITSILTLILLSTASVMAQQGGASAIMRVQVEIVGGAQFEQQIVEAQAETMEQISRGEAVSVAGFSITVPEGSDYSIHMDQEIEMEGSGRWKLQTETARVVSGQTSRYEIEGRAVGMDSEDIQGVYEGRQVAVLEFH